MTLFVLFCFIGLTQTATAQQKSGDEITISSDNVVFDNDPKFECKQLVYNDKTQIMTFIDNVSLKTEKFEFADAGKVVYNQKTKKLTIYDCKGFTVDGKVVTKNNASEKKIVEYTLGDDTVYLL